MKFVSNKTKIFEAWSDEQWTVEGAAVRVAIICIQPLTSNEQARLDGVETFRIDADLTGATSGLVNASQQPENREVSFIGTQKNGPFTLTGEIARKWLISPLNPNLRPNSDVVRPWANGLDITRRPSDTWIIDFGPNMSESEASLYEEPFAKVLTEVKPTRESVRRNWHRTKWWLHGDPRPALRTRLAALRRFIATSMVAKHRMFVWMPVCQIPENLAGC